MTDKRANCIYCGPGKVASSEDVVPYAIGGRYSNSQIICRDCNSYFGASVDCHITDWHPVVVARIHFGLVGHSGDIPSYEVTTAQGQVLIVGRDGVPRSKWGDVTTYDNGRVFSFTGSVPTVAAGQKAIAGFVAKKEREFGRPPNIAVSEVRVHTHREWQDYQAEVTYDFRTQGRAIAKMALHYLATQLDSRFVRGSAFEGIRRFVRFGECPRHEPFCQPTPTVLLDARANPGARHTLTLRCSRECRSAVCDVTLFDILRFTVVLSYGYEGPDLFRRLVVHPLTGEWQEGGAVGESPTPAGLVLRSSEAELEARYARLGESVRALVDWLNYEGFSEYVRQTLPAAIAKECEALRTGCVGLDRWLPAVVNSFSNGSAPAALLRLPGAPARVAVGILVDELSREGVLPLPSESDLEERFTRLVLIRLLVDALSAVVRARCRQPEL